MSAAGLTSVGTSCGGEVSPCKAPTMSAALYTVYCTPSSGPSRVASRGARCPIPGLRPAVRGVPLGLLPWVQPRVLPGLVVARSPMPGFSARSRGLSHVPEASPCADMPRSQTPVGVRGTRHSVPPDCCLPRPGNRRLPTTYIFRGSITRPPCLLLPGSVRPFPGRYAS